MKIIEEFKKIPIANYFRKEYEEIYMSIRLAEDIMDIKNIRSAGDEVEIAVRNFFSKKLFPRYFVGKGHIIDRNLYCSPNYDIIIAENSKNPVLFKHKDDDNIIFFETVYSVIEVKKSLYSDSLIPNFITQIKNTKNILKREDISPNFIETSNSGFYVKENLTDYPLRNRLLFFMFIGESNRLSFSKLKEIIDESDLKDMPNFIVFLDQGLLVNIDEKAYKEHGLIKVNLYPEYETGGIWTFLSIDDPEKVLMFQYLLLVEHLNETIVSVPDLSVYTKEIFNLNNVELITVTRVIAHKVSAKKKDKDAEAELSEELLSFGSKDQQILIDRLTDALLNTTKTFQLDYEDFSENSVHDILHNKYSSFEETDFIAFSQDLAERMAESHFRIKIPGGYSIIGEGETKDGEVFFFIIKAELQEAFNIQKNKLNLIQDIFLSPAKDFYKIGFFLKRSGKFIPFMYDDIFTPQKKDLTEYFYGKFLGLTTDSNDIIRTKNFYEDVKSFLINEIDNAKDRVAMEKTLNSYIREDVSGVISANEFSDKYFEGDIKKKFQKKICEVYPHSFTKNKRLLDRKLELERVVVHVSSEITLVGNTSSLQDIEMSRLNTEAEKNKAIHSINSGKHKTIVLL